MNTRPSFCRTRVQQCREATGATSPSCLSQLFADQPGPGIGASAARLRARPFSLRATLSTLSAAACSCAPRSLPLQCTKQLAATRAEMQTVASLCSIRFGHMLQVLPSRISRCQCVRMCKCDVKRLACPPRCVGPESRTPRGQRCTALGVYGSRLLSCLAMQLDRHSTDTLHTPLCMHETH